MTTVAIVAHLSTRNPWQIMLNDNTLDATMKMITFIISKMAKNLNRDTNAPKIGN
jgi:hypothetical protein